MALSYMTPEELKKLAAMLQPQAGDKAPTDLPTPQVPENYTDNDADRDQKEFSGPEALLDEPDDTEDGIPREVASTDDATPSQGDIKPGDKADSESEDDEEMPLNDEDSVADEADDSSNELAKKQDIDKDGNPIEDSDVAVAPDAESTPEEAALTTKTRTPASIPAAPLKSGSPEYMSDLMKRFKAAQEQSNLNRNLNDFGKYAYAGGTSFRGTQANPQITNALEEEGKRANLPVEQFGQQLQVEAQDPNSPAAAAMRTAYSQALDVDPAKLQNMTIDQMEKSFKFLGDNANNKIKAQAAQLAAQTKQMQAQNQSKKIDQQGPLIQSQIDKNNAQSDYLGQRPDLDREKMSMMKQLKENAQAQKDQKQQTDNMNKTKMLLESARGNPAVAQAEKDVYAAAKANSLANLYGDPNKLSQQQVTMLASEVAKIAQGGVPSMHELDAISPGALNGKLASVYSKLVNHPSPANAGAFIKQYQDYAAALTKDAQKVIKDKYGRVIESSKAGLGENNYAILKNNYLNRFDVPEDAGQPPATQGATNTAPKAPKAAKTQAPQSNKVKVSNGKETLLIDPADVDAAAKDGYNQI